MRFSLSDIGGKIKIWDALGSEHILKYEYTVLGGAIKDIAWTEDSKRIVVGGEGREKYVYTCKYLLPCVFYYRVLCKCEYTNSFHKLKLLALLSLHKQADFGGPIIVTQISVGSQKRELSLQRYLEIVLELTFWEFEEHYSPKHKLCLFCNMESWGHFCDDVKLFP